MIRKFINLNKVALKTAFFGSSFILTLIVLIIFSISYFKGNIPEKDLLIVVLLLTSIFFPAFITFLGYLGWLREYFIFKRNFGIAPFNLVDTVGFEKTIRKNRWTFQVEYFSGRISDCFVDCESQSRYLLFFFYIKPKRFEKHKFKEIQKKLKDNNGYFYFDIVIKKFHFRNHGLSSIDELETELIKFSNLIKSEKIEFNEFANR